MKSTIPLMSLFLFAQMNLEGASLKLTLAFAKMWLQSKKHQPNTIS